MIQGSQDVHIKPTLTLKLNMIQGGQNEYIKPALN